MSRKEQKFVISQDSNILTIYDDNLVDLLDNGGDITVRRASHVEPYHIENEMGEFSKGNEMFATGWVADLAPVGGPKLGPFKTRSEALQAEFDWLDANLTDIPFPAGEK